MDRKTLIDMLTPPCDGALVGSLIDTFAEQESRFLTGDFKPSTLDGGQFCEAAARIVYHIDSSVLSPSKGVDECLQYLENAALPHFYPDAASARQVARVLRSIYKVRSTRGAIHLSPTYSANEMDARFVLDSSRWIFGELVRVLWHGGASSQLGAFVADLIEFEIPLVAVFDEAPFVLRTDVTAAQEILIVLLWHGSGGATRSEIGRQVRRPSQTISNNLTRLSSAGERRIIKLASGHYRLTQLGVVDLRAAGLLRAS